MRKTLQTLFVAAVILSACTSSNSNTANKEPLVVATENATVKYQCPMKCEGDTAYTTEGQCPVCEMDLKKL